MSPWMSFPARKALYRSCFAGSFANSLLPIVNQVESPSQTSTEHTSINSPSKERSLTFEDVSGIESVSILGVEVVVCPDCVCLALAEALFSFSLSSADSKLNTEPAT